MYPNLFSTKSGSESHIGFWQKMEYEGNNAFCTNCGLLGHVNGICRKNAKKPMAKTNSEGQKRKIQKRGQPFPNLRENHHGEIPKEINNNITRELNSDPLKEKAKHRTYFEYAH